MKTTATVGQKSGLTDIHVLPIGDLMDHVESRSCWCYPRHEDENGRPTDVGPMIVIHNALDGRE